MLPAERPNVSCEVGRNKFSPTDATEAWATGVCVALSRTNTVVGRGCDAVHAPSKSEMRRQKVGMVVSVIRVRGRPSARRAL